MGDGVPLRGLPQPGAAPGAPPPGFDPGAQAGQVPEAQSGPFTDDELAAAAIAALGQNRTPTARTALQKLIKGELATIVPDATSTPLAIKALLVHASPAEEDLILAAATTPAKVRPAAKADGLPATELQTQAIAAIDSSAPPEVQARLIKRVVTSKVPAEDRKRLLDALVKQSPASVAGQVDLFVTLAKDDPMRKTLEQYFAQYSAAAMDKLMGLPADALPAPASTAQSPFPGQGRLRGLGQIPGQPQQPAETKQSLGDAELKQIVEHLWTDPVVKTLEQEAVGLEGSPEKFADPLMIGISMPVQSMRTLLDKLQREWWRDGTDHLLLGQRWGDMIRDPALLIVVKRTARKEDPAVRDARLGKTPPAGAAAPGPAGLSEIGGPAAPGRGGKSPPTPRRPQSPRGANLAGGNQPGGDADKQSKEDKARYQWMKASEEFVQSLNARFYAAAQATDKSGTSVASQASSAGAGTQIAAAEPAAAKPAVAAASAAKSPDGKAVTDKSAAGGAAGAAAAYDPTKLPLALHEGAKVVAEYHLNWPADVQRKLKGASVTPLVVHYVRMEEQASLPKLMIHYQKQVRGANSRLLAGGRWLDYNGVGAQAGLARSVDVMITRPGGGPAADGARAGAESVEDLVVEILTIEAPDPKLRAPAK